MKRHRRNPRSRPAMFRILAVANAIRRAKSRIVAPILAEQHSVCEKTIHRDLSWLREIGAPIFFDMERSTYYWNAKLALPWWFGGEREGPLPRF